MEPVSVSDFESPGIVSLFNETDENLLAGNGKIIGLDPNKYYTVEEWDENGLPYYGIVSFVSSSGRLNPNLTGIGRVSNGEITGLNNFHHYRVKSAQPLKGSVSYYYDSAGAVSAEDTTVNAGRIILEPPDKPDYLSFKTVKLDPVYEFVIGFYDIVELPISPIGSTKLIPDTGNVYTPAANGTEIDYVFYDKTPLINNPLFVLKVIVSAPPPPDPSGGLIVKIDYTEDSSPVPNRLSFYYYQDEDIEETFTVANSPDYTGITWYINGAQVGTGSSFILKTTDDIAYRLKGVYTITVEANKDGKPYSAEITVTVLP